MAEEYVAEERTARTWRLRKPNCNFDWFDVTFVPGVLSLTGDLGDVVLTHYHAMPTLKAALGWLQPPISESYLLEKSNQKQEYSPQDTLDHFIMQANEYRDDEERHTFVWNQIGETVGLSFDPSERHGSKAEIEARARAEQPTAQDWYHATGDSEAPSYVWTDVQRRRVALFAVWADLVRPTICA